MPASASRSGPSACSSLCRASCCGVNNSTIGALEADRDGVRGADQDAHLARRTLPARGGRIGMPAAVHAHVRVQHEAVREGHQEVLAARGHRLDRPSDDRMVVVDAADGGEHRLEPRDGLAGEDAVQVRAARKMVSPSGIGHWLAGGRREHPRLPRQARLIAERAGEEAGLDQERRQWMRRRRPPSISSINMPRGASTPLRARSISAREIARPTRDRSGSASGRKAISRRSPRARYAPSAPLTSITVAPTDRVGPRPASAVAGHLSVAPYGFAGSVAARTTNSTSSLAPILSHAASGADRAHPGSATASRRGRRQSSRAGCVRSPPSPSRLG